MATSTKDAVLGSAVEVARAAAVELAEKPEHVGEHLGLVAEGERLVSHRFACAAPGYRGWQWTVTLTRVPRARAATVCEVVLLPGDGAVLAPAWVPWAERLRPGDIGPGDVLPFSPDDPRLEPGYVSTGDEDVDRVAIEELALARARVLSPRGKDEAADRWYAGLRGPTAPAALAAAAPCGSCGFLVRMSGSLGTVFGVCANEWSPDDGKVVSLDHGCGAHSETDVEPQPSEWPAPGPSIDELEVEIVSRIVAHAAETATPESATPESATPETATPESGVASGVAAEATVVGGVVPVAEVLAAEPDGTAVVADVDGGPAARPGATAPHQGSATPVDGGETAVDDERSADEPADADASVDAEPDPDAALLPGTPAVVEQATQASDADASPEASAATGEAAPEADDQPER